MPFGITILLSDFNCVQCPQLDRMGQRTASQPESPALGMLLETSGLSDARLLRNHADDDEAANTTDHLPIGTRSGPAVLTVSTCYTKGPRKSFGCPPIPHPNTLIINEWSCICGLHNQK